MSIYNSQNLNAGHKVELNRTVHVKRFPIIAKITFNRERSDLVSLLGAIEAAPEDIPPRLKVYLKGEGLWDEDLNALTDRGEAVKSSGLYATTERGLYHIWYTDNDPLLGTRPVLMQRDTAFFEPNTKGWLKGNDATHSSFSVDAEREIVLMEEEYDGKSNQQTKQNLMLSKIEPEVVCAYDKIATLDLNWVINHESSIVNLTGVLDILGFHKKKASDKPEKVETSIEDFSECLPSIMVSISDELDATWDGLDQRMAVKLKNIQQYQNAVKNFTIAGLSLPNLKTNYGTFKSAYAQNLAIKPDNQADANQWHEKWLKDFYGKAYRSSIHAREQQASWLDHSALSSFDLGLKDSTALLWDLSKEINSSAYWHVAAMTDLTPSVGKKLMMPISLVNGERLDLASLFSQLSGGKSIDRVIYSDRYVHTNRQSENLNAVAETLCVLDGLLMTLGKQRGKEPQLPDGWTRKSFEKQHDNHGRYWILSAGPEIYCWECTIGLDFIRKTDTGVYVDGTPGFTPKEVNELPQYLQDTISEIMNLEVA